MIIKLLLFLGTFVHLCSSFVATPALRPTQVAIPKYVLKMKNSNDDHNHNKSKIIKLDFSEDMEEPEDKLFKPRYKFGLSEFDMILLRVYVNLVIMIYICNIVLGLY